MQDRRWPQLRLAAGLSGRLLILTVLFVLLAEVLIFTPSVARFRHVWMQDRLGDGHIAALAIVAAPEGMVTPYLERELLRAVNAHAVDLTTPGRQTLMLGGSMPPEPDIVVDMAIDDPLTLILDAFESMAGGRDRIMRIDGPSPHDEEALVTMIVDETPLVDEMIDYGWRILWLSIVISLITAGLLFLTLRWMMVKPLARFSEALVSFREDPNDARHIIRPTGRTDEIGIAERELASMQTAVLKALKSQARLAALGTAVTKINHDLRNILATAALVSERLAASADPEVQKTAPRLLDAIDRAVRLCTRTLDWSRGGGPPLTRERVKLLDLVEVVTADAAAIEGLDFADGSVETKVRVEADVVPGLLVAVDREQFLRVLDNLVSNAVKAGAGHVKISARLNGDKIEIDVADDGPGLPPRAREHLFQPFAGSARPGGTGLGLAIAKEIMAAHKGEIALVETGPKGTVFRLTLPT